MHEREQLTFIGPPRPEGNAAASNYALAGVAVLLIVGIALTVNRRSDHWFLVPVGLCGVLAGADVVAWLRRQLDTFDPKAIIGIIWFHGTFLAPILHVSGQAHTPLFDTELWDWPHWFGIMALINVPGLVLYKLSQRGVYRWTKSPSTVWGFNRARFFPTLFFAIVVSASAAAVVFFRFGALHQESDVLLDVGKMAHASWLLMLGDPLTLLIVAGIVCMLSTRPRRASAVTVVVILVLLLLAQLSITGLRGSRSAVVYVLFIGTVLCHVRLRKVPVSWVLAGMIALGVPAYYYKYFKHYGTRGLEALQKTAYLQTLSHRAGITPVAFLLGDLSRAEVQAFLAYRLYYYGDDYELRWGKTYVMAGLTIIPRAIWPSKPSGMHGKVAAGTDLQQGEGSYHPRWRKSSRVYGLQGEAMLNFGFLGVPLAYIVFGAWMGWYRRKLAGLDPDDARMYLVPIVTMATFTACIGDADNTFFAFLKYGVLLACVILISSQRAAPARLDAP